MFQFQIFDVRIEMLLFCIVLERFQAKWRPVRARKRVKSRARFQAKACPGLDPGWEPVRVKTTRQNKKREETPHGNRIFRDALASAGVRIERGSRLGPAGA